MALESFNAYHSYLTAIEPLNDTERGRLFTALLTYSSTGEVPDLRGNERFVFPQMKWQIDRDKSSYNDFCARQSENGKKGGRPKKPTVNFETQKTQAFFEKPKKAIDKDKDKDKDKDILPPIEGNAPARHAHGQYGWVKLTDSEYSRLLADLGEAELARCIAYVDESAQSNGNKNKWKDWNLTVRKCHRDGWGLGKGRKITTAAEYSANQSACPTLDELDGLISKI